MLVIGRNDKGVAVGVPEARRLLAEIPNKVRDVLGIMVDVNLLAEAGKELLEIRVEPYPCPVSYKGEYHYRSGSTKQELKGAALSRFLLKKLFRDELQYRYLGDWSDHAGNSNIDEGLLTAYLAGAGYSTAQISRALDMLRREADHHGRTLYANNQAVYGLLRYGVQVKIEAGRGPIWCT